MAMKTKRIVPIAIFLFFAMLIGTALEAVPVQRGPRLEIKSSSTGLGIWGAYYIPVSDRLGSGTFGGMLTFQLGLGQYFGFEIAANYSQFSTPGTTNDLQKGNLLRIPLQLSVKGRLPLGKAAVTVLGGAHYALNQFSIDDAIQTKWNQSGFTVAENIDPGLGFQGGLGFEFAFSRSLAVGLDARYLIAKGTGEYKLTDRKSGEAVTGPLADIQLDHMVFSLGLIFTL